MVVIKKQKSFTLVEILVAVGIFSIVIGIAVGIFISAIRVQRKALAEQELLDQTSYVMEYMSRAIRMAKKDDIGGTINCCGSDKVNFEYFSGGGKRGIRFRNYDDICQEFYLQGNKLVEHKYDNSDDYGTNDLTSPALKVNDFNIGPNSSWDQDDDEQPRVTMFLNIQRRGEKPEEQPEIQIQTTVSQRNPDVER